MGSTPDLQALVPSCSVLSRASSGSPSLGPSQESASPRWCSLSREPGHARGFPPPACLPAFSHHTYLSCPIRLGLLPSEPDKEATGQGRDRQGLRQEWGKEGGEEDPGLSCVASEGKKCKDPCCLASTLGTGQATGSQEVLHPQAMGSSVPWTVVEGNLRQRD